MAKITKKAQKTFGGGLTATNNIAQFGSLKAGSPAYSLDPDTIQSLSAYDNGWAAAVVNNNAPALQDVNALDFLFSRQLSYLMQAGIAEWDAATTYYIGSVVNDGYGNLYYSIADTNLNNAVTDATKWISYKLAYVGTNPEVGGSTPFQMVYTNNKISVLNPGGAITVKLPTTSVKAGEIWSVSNRSAFVLTIQSSDGDTIMTCGLGSQRFVALQAAPTDQTHWLLLSGSPTSQVRSDTGNGLGSTNIYIRKLTNHVTIGSDITAVTSATLGTYYTINRAGVYAMSYSDSYSSGTSFWGISLNATVGTSCSALSPAMRLIGTNGTTYSSACAATSILNVGDIIRPHTNGANNFSSDNVQFIITQMSVF